MTAGDELRARVASPTEEEETEERWRRGEEESGLNVSGGESLLQDDSSRNSPETLRPAARLLKLSSIKLHDENQSINQSVFLETDETMEV